MYAVRCVLICLVCCTILTESALTVRGKKLYLYTCIRVWVLMLMLWLSLPLKSEVWGDGKYNFIVLLWCCRQYSEQC